MSADSPQDLSVSAGPMPLPALLRFLNGPRAGYEIELDPRSVSELEGQVAIEWINGHYYLRSLTREPVLVSSKLVLEKRLVHDDRLTLLEIDIEFSHPASAVPSWRRESEQAFEPPPRPSIPRHPNAKPRNGNAQNGSRRTILLRTLPAAQPLLLFIAVVCLLATAFALVWETARPWAPSQPSQPSQPSFLTEKKNSGQTSPSQNSYAKRAAPPATIPGATSYPADLASAASPSTASPAAGAVPPSLKPSPRIDTLPALRHERYLNDYEHSQRLRIARARYEAAEDHYRLVSLDPANLHQAIRLWQSTLSLYDGVAYPPQIYDITQRRLRDALRFRQETVTYLKHNAFVAIKAGRPAAARTILLDLMSTLQDPMDPDYNWARTKITEL